MDEEQSWMLREAGEDRSVAPVEAHLDRVAGRFDPALLDQGARMPVARAISICPCVSMDDAPNWVIFERERGGEILWNRVPDGIEADDFLVPVVAGGGHADPGQVLGWLEGRDDLPWDSSSGWGEDAAALELTPRLRMEPPRGGTEET